MTQATIHEAKTHLSRLIRKALEGQEVVIANRDKPLVRQEGLVSSRRAKRFGGLKHRAKRKGADFDHPKLNREIERNFNKRDRKDPLPSK